MFAKGLAANRHPERPHPWRDRDRPRARPSRQLYTDGAEVLYDFAADKVDPEVVASLVVDVVREELKRIEFGADGYAALRRVPGYRSDVVCDPTRSFGRPIFVPGGTHR